MDYSGQRINHYLVIEKLGLGGMATVYKAYDTRLERDVAIKIVRKDSIPAEQHGRVQKRFEREAKSLAKFLHPNIVPIYDYGEYQGVPYLVMAYLRGGTLKSRIGKPVPIARAVGWVVPVAKALSYAHKEGVVHRDVKPSNILISQNGEVMLSDFGIAQILMQETTQLTVTGMGVGTPEYMAPEQWQGRADERSDQYALGVVLYELLTGIKPYTADTPLAVALKVMSEPLQRPSALVGSISEGVEKVLYKALAHDPQDRFRNMEAFQQALDGLIFQTETAGVYVESTAMNMQEPAKDLAEAEILNHLDYSGWGVDPEDYSEDVQDETSTQSHLESERTVFLPVRLNAEDETIDVLDRTSVEGVATTGTSPGTTFQKRVEPSPVRKAGWKVIGGVGSWAVFGVLLLIIILTVTFTLTAIASAKKANQMVTKVQHEATQQAQMTATAQPAFLEFENFILQSNLVVSVDQGILEHYEDGYIEEYYTDVFLEDFALEVTFFNPYDETISNFSYGIGFFGEETYYFYLRTGDRWNFVKREEDFNYLDGGYVRLKTGQGEKNKFQLGVIDGTGYWFVNDHFVTALDLSMVTFPGEIFIMMGFVKGDEVDGYTTKFEDLRIYGIDGKSFSESFSFPNKTPTNHPTTKPTEVVSTRNPIKINTHGIEYKKNEYRYRYNVFFENPDGWDSDSYSLMIQYVGDSGGRGGAYCAFYPETVDCQFADYNGETYVYCFNYLWESSTDPENPCIYEITLFDSNSDSVYIYNYNYLFTGHN